MSEYNHMVSEEIDLKDLLLIIRKRMRLIIGITLLSVLISGLISVYVLVPQYETFTTLMLGKPADFTGENAAYDYQDVLLNQRLVKTYGEIAKSKVVLTEVIENLNLNTTYGRLKNQVTVSLLNDTEIIKVTVTGSRPNEITRIANEMAVVFMENVSEIMRIDNVLIIDEAEVPTAPISPRVLMNVAIAGVLGLMIALGLVFLLEFLDQSIKTPDDIKQHFGITVLGIIPVDEE